MRSEHRRARGTTGGIDYALLVDGLAAEREQGITIDLAWRFLDVTTETGDGRRIVLADAALAEMSPLFEEMSCCLMRPPSRRSIWLKRTVAADSAAE